MDWNTQASQLAYHNSGFILSPRMAVAPALRGLVAFWMPASPSSTQFS